MTNILKHTYTYLIITLLLVLAACNNELDMPKGSMADSPGTITLHLKNSAMTRSAASDNAETAIKNLYIGIYKSSLDGSPAVWLEKTDLNENDSYTLTVPLTNEIVKNLFGENPKDDDECMFFVIANLDGSGEITENPTMDEMKNLAIRTEFMTDTQDSFVMAGEGVAKYTTPGSQDKIGKISGSATLIRAAAKIRLNVKFADVTTKDEAGNDIIWKPITGKNDIKVLINNGVEEAITVPDVEKGWQPGGLPGGEMGGGAEMQLLSDSGLGDNGLDDPFLGDTPDDLSNTYYSSSLKVENSVRYLTYSDSEDYPYQMDIPFYTYPNVWTETLEETRKTTLTLIVPWHKEGDPEGTNYTFYYQVPITQEYLDLDLQTMSIARNTSYNIFLNVAMLGNITPDDPKELEDLSYKIVDWGEEKVDVNISDYRYLVVNPTTYTINNEDVIMIPFYTSHECDIDNITMTYQRFNYPKNGSGEVVDISVGQDVIDNSHTDTDKMCDYSIYTDEITGQKYIRIEHPMIMWTPKRESGSEVSLTEIGEVDGDGMVDQESLDELIGTIVRYDYPTKPEMAFFPYTFKLTISHIDNHTFTEDVEITQYPGMYIVAERNYGGEYLTYSFADDNYEDNAPIPGPNYYDYGFTFLNPTQEITEKGLAWRNADIWGTSPKITDPAADKEEVMSKYREFYYKGLGGLKVYPGLKNSGDVVNPDLDVANPNMYVLNITQLLDSGTQNDYIIGDTRSKNVNNLLTNESMALGSDDPAGEWCNQAKALYGSSERTLKYYHPTDESDAYKMMIAPKLRISSAFGYVRFQNSIIDCTIGRRRAATYQEQGYPAGRWRLPTYGEVQFLVKLSRDKKIPVLFKEGQSYLTAQGAYTIQDDGTLVPTTADDKYTGVIDRGVLFDVWYSDQQSQWLNRNNSGVNVRPVYDEWYWEKQPNSKLNEEPGGGYVYTLGDAPVKFN